MKLKESSVPLYQSPYYAGYVDMTRYPSWNISKNELSGISKVVGGEPYRVIIALNGFKPVKAIVREAKASVMVLDEKNGLAVLEIKKD